MFESRSAHQGKYKRSLASVYHLCEDEGKSSFFQFPTQLNQAFTDAEGRDAFMSASHDHAKGGRLVRSESFPPVGWYNTGSEYILNICKNLDVKAEVCERHCGNVGNEVREDTPFRESKPSLYEASPGHTFPVPVERASVLSLISESISDNPSVPVSVVSATAVGLSYAKSPLLLNDPYAMIVVGDVVNMCDDKSSAVTEDTACPISPEGLAVIEESNSTNHLLGSVPAIPPSGKLLVCGRRREMEDTAVIIPSFLSYARHAEDAGKKVNLDWHFYGVFDGHGGSQASTYCMERLHQIVAEELFTANAFGVGEEGVVDSGNIDWEEVMKAAFLAIDMEIGGVFNKAKHEGEEGMDSCSLCCQHSPAPENVGTAAVVAIVGSHQIIVGNCGDSRAVLGRGGQAIPLSRDHKPELEDETRRIEAAGGRVICWDGHREGGLLALSRATETTCSERSEEDECLIIASDGLWDVVSNEFACEIARRSLPVLRKKYASWPCAPDEDAASSAVAALLVKLAYGRGSKDNIAVIVVDLKSREVEHGREQG